ncbi:receptor-like protein kinase THESEUS 1 [Abrus precatorius]|uniref:Receptor-like protein kinase THESEUS 1 n=1 Tax=Abrus precatorius TaxID=3816 RepID=A0A8B8LKC6_ABRPR|nr:receptor-like protein kinase THESEUS 1 [Abrus precatorius]
MRIPFCLAFLLYLCKESLASFIPIDNYLVACGSSDKLTFQDRTFIPDSEHANVEIKAMKSVALTTKHGVPSPLYQSARVFSEQSSYKFKIEQQGRHWIRLYFHPFPHSNPNMAFASITVVTDNSFVLLNNFIFQDNKDSYLFKEYVIIVTSNELLLTFIPHHNSIVFVNAVEVVSMPDLLFPQLLNPPVPSNFALETVYRLNIGGASIASHDDILSRTWENDEIYFHSASTAVNISTNTSSIKPMDFLPITAPPLVYASAKAWGDDATSGSRLSWNFSVSPDFIYFVRIHFCNIISNVSNSLHLDLFINEGITLKSLVLSFLTGDLAEPYFKGFVTNGKGNSLTVSVSPDMMTDSTNATMNGLEILKISNDFGSLDGFSSVDDILTKSSKISTKLKVIIIGCTVSVFMFLAFLGLSLCYLIARRREKKSEITFKFPKRFTLQAIKQATNDFDQSLLIGEGGFGKVYQGTLENGETVAIKVANHESKQGLNEFHNEIELLSGLGHPNLVSLIGCCTENSELILVYKYMAKGSFSSHLYGTDFVPLSWKQRLGICIGAAKGLCYLHFGAKHSIIHRDVKTANILLDENLVAKVADFGISKKGRLDKSHVTTNVKGSFGYLDPDYFRTKCLTEKSDVYSFGAVLIEVICGKPALDDARPTQHVNLAIWALNCHENGTFHEMMDPYLIGKVNMDSLTKVSELAWKCLHDSRVKRPPMAYVLCQLEEALHLELSSPLCNGSADSVSHAHLENGFANGIEDVA